MKGSIKYNKDRNRKKGFNYSRYSYIFIYKGIQFTAEYRAPVLEFINTTEQAAAYLQHPDETGENEKEQMTDCTD